MRATRPDDQWPVTWEAARDALLDAAWAAMPAQRLAWLEASWRLAFASGALESALPPDGCDADSGRGEP